ncbi:MAG: ion transporter, partial [Oscillospiraceae bacterium]|nr:ion transporter [Oscillospiraceae bacterium]
MLLRLKRGICNIIRDDGQKSLANRVFSNFITLLIVINIVMVLIELVADLSEDDLIFFAFAEMVAVIIFTIEYLLRLWTADMLYPTVKAFRARGRYVFSPMSLVDLAAIVPFYLQILPFNTAIIRMLRLLRLLRILKMNRYSESKTSEKILTSIKEAIVIMDSDYNLLSANKAAEELFPTIKTAKKYSSVTLIENFPLELTSFTVYSDSANFSLEEDTFFSADISRLYDREKLL